MTKSERRSAELGLAYGMGAARLAKLLTKPEQKITRKNAEKLTEAMRRKFALDKFVDDVNIGGHLNGN